MNKALFLTTVALATTLGIHAQWNTDETPNCVYDATGQSENYARNPQAQRTSDGKTWLYWMTWGRKEIGESTFTAVRTYVQLLDSDGCPVFDEPILVNDHATPTWWSSHRLCIAADGSAIVTVADSRCDEPSLEAGGKPSAFQPAIYKIDQDGNFLWGLDGITYSDYGSTPTTDAYVVGEDTYFIFKTSDRKFIQRIDNDGVAAWPEPREWESSSMTLQIVPSADGDFLLFDDCEEGARVHRLTPDLTEVWGEPVVYDSNVSATKSVNPYRIASDGKGGAAVAYMYDQTKNASNIRVQYISADGTLGFGLSGLDAYCSEEYDHNYCNIALNPETEEVLVDFESKLATGFTVMLQKFNYAGDYLFGEEAQQIAQKDLTNNYSFGPIGSGALPGGDWIVAYRDVEGYVQNSFVIARYDAEGNQVWKRTIGRNLEVTGAILIVEPEASYLFYREQGESKAPGIKVFRIFNENGDYTVPTTADDSEAALTAPFELVMEETPLDDMGGWLTYGGQLGDELAEDEGDFSVKRYYTSENTLLRYMPEDEESYSWVVSPLIDLGNDPTASFEAYIDYTSDEEFEGEYFNLQLLVAPEGEAFSEAHVIGKLDSEELCEMDEQDRFSAPFANMTGLVRLAIYAEGEGEWLPWLTIDAIGISKSGGTTGIALHNNNIGKHTTSIFNSAGQPVTGLQRGVNILRFADGSIRKVVRR